MNEKILTSKQITELCRQFSPDEGIAMIRGAEQMIAAHFESKESKRLMYLAKEGCAIVTKTGYDDIVFFSLYWPELDESQDQWFYSPEEAIDHELAEIEKQLKLEQSLRLEAFFQELVKRNNETNDFPIEKHKSVLIEELLDLLEDGDLVGVAHTAMMIAGKGEE